MRTRCFLFFLVSFFSIWCKLLYIHAGAKGAGKETPPYYAILSHMPIANQDIANILREIGLILEMDEVAFKPRAYERAAETIRGLNRNIVDIYKKGGEKALDALPDIGEGIGEKIEELIKTGKMKEYQKLKKKYPVDVMGLSKIEGVGPNIIKTLYKKKNIRTVKEMEAAAKKGTIGKLKGFGKKTEENILRGIGFLRTSGGRFLLGSIYPDIEELVRELSSVNGVKTVTIAGSVRRMKETIGDLDLVAVAKKSDVLMDAFVSLSDVKNIIAKGSTKSSVRMRSGLDVDLRIIGEESYGSALSYFTGSRNHSIAMRNLALEKGYTLNEYGLFKNHKKKKGRFVEKNGALTKDAKKRYVAGKTEKELYRALGLQYIPPELREDAGEIDLAKKKKIPKLIGYDDLKGDLQIQTTWTDGRASIFEMAAAAKQCGLAYIAVTDHTKALGIAGGLDEKKLARQGKEIDKVNKKMHAFTILKSAEVNIMKDGSLDMADKTLAGLDLVGAAVHTNFNLSKKQMTARICIAMHHPHVDILFHPTGRRLHKRPPYDVDVDEVIRVAKKTGTILEINGAPERLDLKDEFIKKAVEAKVKLCIDSDGHDASSFDFLKFGIGQARRGGAKKTDIINAWPAKKMLSSLKKRKKR